MLAWSIFHPFGRRIGLWALLVQLVLGARLLSLHAQIPLLHSLLWLLAALCLQAAVLLHRRGVKPIVVKVLAADALLAAAGAFALGMSAGRT